MKSFYENHGLGWLGGLLIFYGYYLNANKDPNGWIVWGVGNFLVGFYCFQKEAYATAFMSFALVLMNIYGYFSWLK